MAILTGGILAGLLALSLGIPADARASEIEVRPLPAPGEGAVRSAPLPEPAPVADPVAEPEAAPAGIGIRAILRGLDKMTGQARTFEAPVGAGVGFGRLLVRVMACDQGAPDLPSESAAFLQVRDPLRPPEQALVFSGWMFAASPELSAMDHARYDIWVLRCRTS